MRNRRPGSPIPVIVLGVIAIFAIVAHILAPKQANIPGPVGSMPLWKSAKADGTMSAWAVNPSGTIWTGAWNKAAKDGKTQSAAWIIDFDNETAKPYRFKTGSSVKNLEWVNNNTFKVTTEGVEPGVSYIDAAKSDKINDAEPVIDTAALPTVEVSPDRRSYSYKKVPGSEPKPAFTADQIPGTIEETWASPLGILVLGRNADDFAEYVWDAKTGKINQIGKDGYKTDIKTNWPEAAQTLMFVTYRGGFSYDMVTRKRKQLFDYADLRAGDDRWRNEVQDGRLYPRKNGGYTSISFVADTIDIRILNKDGRPVDNLLPRS